MTFDQWLHNLRQALGVQEQQIRIVSGALLFLLCIVLWERSQWTQPARSDLLYDLPQAHPSTNLEAPSTAGSTSTDFSTWSCQHSEAWFEQQPHRWHEFEALAGLVCYVNAASKATDELNSADQQQDRALYHDIVNTAHQNTDAQKLVEQVQARIVMTEEALRRDRVPPEEARGDPRPVQSGPWSWIIFKRVLSGLGLLDTSLTPNSTFVREARPVPLDYKKYSEDHPVKALVGLNALLTSPRLFTLIMKCTSSRFRPDNIKQLLLVKAANQAAEVPKQFMLFFVKRSIIGNLVSMLLPGLQTCMYGQACVDDNPYLGRWLVVMGLTSQALEIWSLIATLDSTMAPPEMGNVLMCTYIILPLFNTAFSIIFMTMVAFTLPEPNYSLMVAIEAAVLPFLTLWANAIVGLPHMGLHDPAPPAQEGRQARNAFVQAWNAAVENAGLPAEAARQIPDMPQLPEPAPAREHRNRDRDHNRKEVHWPPPLIIPEHLEDIPEIPDSFKCPITFAIMKEPATTRNGLTYDRPAIMRWIEQHRRDPTTAQKLKAHHLSPNLSLRTVIQSWIDSHR